MRFIDVASSGDEDGDGDEETTLSDIDQDLAVSTLAETTLADTDLTTLAEKVLGYGFDVDIMVRRLSNADLEEFRQWMITRRQTMLDATGVSCPQ